MILQWKRVTLRDLVTYELDQIRTNVRPYELTDVSARRDRTAFRQGCRIMSQLMASLVVFAALNPSTTPRTVLWNDLKAHEYWLRYRMGSENGQRMDYFMYDFIMQNYRGFSDVLSRMEVVKMYEVEPSFG